MKKSIKAIFVAGLLALSLALTACGSKADPASGSATASGSTPAATVTIKVGATPSPHGDILNVVKPILAEQGINLEIVEFSDYVTPNLSLEDGSLDANYFQHQPYLDNFNAENPQANLVSAGGIHIEPMGVYADSLTDLADLPDGATVLVPNDATNEGRALLLLEAQGLITLNDGAGLEATPNDIKTNSKNLKFVELPADQLPQSLADGDIAIINGNYAITAKIQDKLLLNEGADSPYVNVVAVRSGDENRPEIIALIAALQSDAVRTYINETYDGAVIAVF